MISVTFPGLGIEPVNIEDNERLLEACGKLADQDLEHIPIEDSRVALHSFLQTLHAWYVRNGCTLQLAHLSGLPFVPLEDALGSHNFVGMTVLGRAAMQLPELPAQEEPPAGPNDHVEGGEDLSFLEGDDIERIADYEAEKARAETGLEEGDFGDDEVAP